MTDRVYVVSESTHDHHAIVAIYGTSAEAEREAAYCRAMQKRTTRPGMDYRYTVTEHVLGESGAGVLVRFDAAGTPKMVDFFSGFLGERGRFGEVRDYDTVWPNGVCRDVYARTVEDAARALRADASHPAG